MSLACNALAAALPAACLGGPAFARTVRTRFSGSIVDNDTVAAQAASPVDGNPISGSAGTGGLFFGPSTFCGDLTTLTSVVRVRAGRNRDVLSERVYETVVTHPSDTPMAPDFRFFIGRDRLGIDDQSDGDSFSGSAALDATITWNDVELWRVYLGMTGSGIFDGVSAIETYSPTLEKSASAAGFTAYESGSNLYDDPYAGTLGLGILGAHETRTLTYRVAGSGHYTTNAEVERYGYGGQAVVGNTDPFDFEGRPVDDFGNPLPGGIQPVPEPETWAMPGVGLAALGLGTRRRRRAGRKRRA